MSAATRFRSASTPALLLLAGLVASACSTPCGGCCGAGVAAPPTVAAQPVPEDLPAPTPVPAAEVAAKPGPATAPAAAPAVVPAAKPGPQRSAAFGKPGFAVFEDEGRLWVFPEGTADLEEFLTKGEPAKRVTRLGAGPGGRTVLSSELATIEAYAALWPRPLPASDPAARTGFVVFDEDGRYWVFREGSKELTEFHEKGEPAKRVTRLGASPDGRTIVAPDAEVVDAYLTATP